MRAGSCEDNPNHVIFRLSIQSCHEYCYQDICFVGGENACNAPRLPTLAKSVTQDCLVHTSTLISDSRNDQKLT